MVEPVVKIDHAVAIGLDARQRLVRFADHDRVARVVRADLLGDPGRGSVVALEAPPLIGEARDEAAELHAAVAVLPDGVEQGRQDVDPPAADRDRLRGRDAPPFDELAAGGELRDRAVAVVRHVDVPERIGCDPCRTLEHARRPLGEKDAVGGELPDLAAFLVGDVDEVPVGADSHRGSFRPGLVRQRDRDRQRDVEGGLRREARRRPRRRAQQRAENQQRNELRETHASKLRARVPRRKGESPTKSAGAPRSNRKGPCVRGLSQ